MTPKHCKLPPIISRRQALAVGFAAACKLSAPWWMGPAEAYSIATQRPFPPMGAGNLVAQSGYGATGITLGATAVRAPNKDFSFEIIEDSANSNHYINSPSFAKAASSIQYWFSVYIRRQVGSRDYATLATDAGLANFSVFYFSLTNGAQTNAPGDSGANITANSQEFRQVPGGFFHLRALVTFSAAITTVSLLAALIDPAAVPSITYLGDGTSSIRFFRPRVAVTADGPI